MKDKVIIFNSFMHDVATGTWIGSLVAMTILHREVTAHAWPGMAVHVGELKGRFLALTWVSLGVVMLTGVVRAFTFKAFGWTGDVARDRIRLLKVKHAALGIAFAAGTVWQVWLAW